MTLPQESPSDERPDEQIVWIHSLDTLGFVLSPGAHASKVAYRDKDGGRFEDTFLNEDLTYIGKD